MTDKPDRPRLSLFSLGPAIITASVVLGPGSILSSSKIGYEFGYQMAWVLLVALALMLGMTALSARLGLGYERFRKVFRQRVGMSPGEYRIRRRIDRARALIAQHRLSNTQVAHALGYRDPFTFSKQFKQVVGVSPGAFRRTV